MISFVLTRRPTVAVVSIATLTLLVTGCAGSAAQPATRSTVSATPTLPRYHHAQGAGDAAAEYVMGLLQNRTDLRTPFMCDHADASALAFAFPKGSSHDPSAVRVTAVRVTLTGPSRWRVGLAIGFGEQRDPRNGVAATATVTRSNGRYSVCTVR
jgi:hypothetical protein